MKSFCSKTVSCFILLTCFIYPQLKENKPEIPSNIQSFIEKQKLISTEDGIKVYSPKTLERDFYSGKASGDQYGYTVAGAGDVNGDGYNDFIVAAPFADHDGYTDAGNVYLYFGGPSVSANPDLTFFVAPTGNSEQYGCSVAGAGDVNGDGFADIVVGAKYKDNPFTDCGAAYIYFGGKNMNTVADLIFDGIEEFQNLGTSVASAGDVNGDGYSDVIIGSPGSDGSVLNLGKAYIFFGGVSMNNIADLILYGLGNADNWFGGSVASAGDVNGDGYSDVIVGANGNSSYKGCAYLYYGSPSMDNMADLVLQGDAANDNWGSSVACAGDVNGDGYSDFMIGGRLALLLDNGKVSIFYGGPSADNVADITFVGKVNGDHLGPCSSGGDINADGFDDVLIGAPDYDNNGNSAIGRVYVLFGGAAMDNKPDMIISGENVGDQFGSALANLGDIDGDGLTDFLCSSVSYDNGSLTDAGRVYLFSNKMQGFDTPDEFFTNSGNGSLGWSGSISGDYNGDGYKDILIAEPYPTLFEIGKVHIYFGGEQINNSPDITLNGTATNVIFGYKVNSAGDFNGDGKDDILVSVHSRNGTVLDKVYMYFGGNTINSNPDLIFSADSLNQYFGTELISGDFNKDGFSDIILTTQNFPYFVRIYFGSATPNTQYDIELTNSTQNAVTNAGDINNDGYPEVIVGDHYTDIGTNQNAGRVYIYAPTKSPRLLRTIDGTSANQNFGKDVSGAGDINGDGIDDFIISSNDFINIFYGGQSIDNTSDVTIPAIYDMIPYSAGDINGDGFNDLIINSVNGGQIYFGGKNMDSNSDISLHRAYEFSHADLNKDGVEDLMAFYGSYGASLYLSSPLPVNPRLAVVKDVPNDQGGYLTVNWYRSEYDANSQDRIENYVIQRSLPPAKGIYAWEDIGTVVPREERLYSFTAGTLYDLDSLQSGTFFFRVLAVSGDNEIWKSNILSGHSIDNTAPRNPLNFIVVNENNKVKMSWKANTETDFKNYLIYKSNVAQLSDSVKPFASTTDTLFTDVNTDKQIIYYFVKAQDIHNNLSKAAIGNVVLSAGGETEMPKEFSMSQNYPNPFNPSTKIDYQLPVDANVSIEIYNLSGEKISDLVNRGQSAGYYTIEVKKELPSGVYFYKLTAKDNATGKNFISIKKLMVLK